jgi:glutamate synthase (NADPH/NADH) large chain
MSGGRAWLLDLDRGRLNVDLVDPAPPDAAALERLQVILAAHAAAVGSAVAARLLAAGPDELAARFTVLVPRDYARVMAARAAAEAEGLSDEQVTERMMEASHG